MARPANPHPTDGELEILHVLWEQGPSSLGNICETLRRRREVATTTVATMLKVMLGKGLVKRSSAKTRGYVWSASVSRGKTAAGMVGKIIDRVFEGSAQQLVAHLVESGQLTDKELDELQRLVATGAKGKKRTRAKGKR